jgi:hypothetical protein
MQSAKLVPRTERSGQPKWLPPRSLRLKPLFRVRVRRASAAAQSWEPAEYARRSFDRDGIPRQDGRAQLQERL